MIISAAILSRSREVYIADFIPDNVRKEIQNQVDSFLLAVNREENGADELPYFETTYSRYVFKETGDLYWLIVTKTESDLDSDISLLGRFVCTILEYGAPETTSATLTDEQKDLFYRHIWRAWDDSPQCLTCGRYNSQAKIWETDFEGRVQFLASIRDNQVDEQDVAYFNDLISESWAISAKLAHEHTNESICSNDTISEEAVVDGCRLACLLEDIRLALRRIQDPYMRLFARRDLLKNSILTSDNNIDLFDTLSGNNNINNNTNNNSISFDNSYDESSSLSH